ncbi:MAG: nucleotide-binding protein [Undibacterium sp.]|nr:nucleotide-binding protein [Undibacterium sp.]
MKRTVFYSWQSDLPNSTNRGFIQTALERALKNIHKDKTESIEPVLDRDTEGQAGSPQISDSIFAKITLADIFVCDVSIINAESGGRPTPNPNVLIELGYAIAQLGWNRVLLIQNTVHGGPEVLPFDLRGRRIISYEQEIENSDKATARGILTAKLEAGLKEALVSSVDTLCHAGPSVPIWWGNWETVNDGGMNGGSIFIYEVGPAGFLFDLKVYSGAHTGTINGYARIVASDLAYFRKSSEHLSEICEIVIRRRLSENTHIIQIEETGTCSYWRGMGAWFGGTFIRKRDLIFDGAILDELDLARLYRLLGIHYESFRVCFQGIGEQDNLDPFIATIGVGGVRGLYTIMEAIVMRGERGELWVAFIDNDIIRYFTTESAYKNILPITIDVWRAAFKNKEIVYTEQTDYIPKSII